MHRNVESESPLKFKPCYKYIYKHTFVLICLHLYMIYSWFDKMITKVSADGFEVTLSISLAMLLYTALQLHPDAADSWNYHQRIFRFYKFLPAKIGEEEPTLTIFLQMGEKKVIQIMFHDFFSKPFQTT